VRGMVWLKLHQHARFSMLPHGRRSGLLWELVSTLVDMCTPLEALEDVAYELVAAMKLHPKLYGGDYRVWFGSTTAGFKKEVTVWFNHSSNGEHPHAAGPEAAAWQTWHWLLQIAHVVVRALCKPAGCRGGYGGHSIGADHCHSSCF
jgi:hypothetical protein